MTGFLALLGYLLTIPAANFLIANVGTTCVPSGPCLVPVAFGLMAPSGVLLIGAALVLRDFIHSRFGAHVAGFCILAGSVISYALAPPALVFASTMAFILSEFADLFVYAPLRRRRLVLAVLASGIIGSVVDSAVFLWLAFGGFDFMAGQVVGKLWMTLAAALFLSMRCKSTGAA